MFYFFTPNHIILIRACCSLSLNYYLVLVPLPRRYYYYDCLSVWLLGLHKYYCLDLLEKNQMGLGPTYISLDFKSHLDHRLNTKKKIIWIFPFTYYYVPWQKYALSECSYNCTVDSYKFLALLCRFNAI